METKEKKLHKKVKHVKVGQKKIESKRSKVIYHNLVELTELVGDKEVYRP
jgi:hypothetical protein